MEVVKSGASVFDFVDFTPSAFVMAGVGGKCDEAWQAAARWPGCRIVGFDPHPDAGGPFPGELRQVALWSHAGRMDFSVQPWEDGTSSCWRHEHPEYVATVDANTLDAELPGLRNAILWMDCEGAELQVLAGAIGTLGARGIRAVQAEVVQFPRAVNWPVYSMIDHALRTVGFKHVARCNWRDDGLLSDDVWLLEGEQ